MLLHSLEEDASPYMKDITTTIQQEQNQIIRDETQPLLLVNGIAGSGKTSAIMQRIAYLLYQHRAEITADNILLLSPNSTFIDYISQVLPNLGERNPLNLTLLQFCASLPKNHGQWKKKRTISNALLALRQRSKSTLFVQKNLQRFF